MKRTSSETTPSTPVKTSHAKPRSIPGSLWAGRTPENSKLVEVLWRDIHSEPNWEDEGIQGPKREFRSWGFLLYNGDDPLSPGTSITIIASTFDNETDKWADYTSFPQGVVVEVRVVKKPRRRKDGDPTD